MSRPIRAELSLSALKHNLDQVCQRAVGSRVLAVIKANAYGHGLLDVADALQSADGFAVADLAEAKALRSAGFKQPICLFAGCQTKHDFELAVTLAIEPVIHSSAQLNLLEQLTTVPEKLWLKFDSGLHRLGFDQDQLAPAIRRLRALSPIPDVVLMSHLASADQLDDLTTSQQQASFEDVVSGYDHSCSLLNSAGVLGDQLPAYDWVRPGIALYGASPLAGRSAEQLNLKPVMTLMSEIIAISNVAKGERVGYGGIWTAPRACRIATIACGYADGYPRHAKNQTPVLVKGNPVPLVGRVSMDLMTIDVTDLDSVSVGDEVTLWGQGLAIDEIAKAAGTISYELMCGVSSRVPRVITS